MKPSLRLVSVALASLVLCSCGVIQSAQKTLASLGDMVMGTDRPQAPSWRSVTASADVRLNQDSPIALDLVFVSEPALVQALQSMPADKWFAGRRDLLGTFPDKLWVLSLELVPGQMLELPAEVLQAQRALSVLVFAHYPGPGEHRQRLLLQARGYLIALGPMDFVVSEIRAGQAE